MKKAKKLIVLLLALMLALSCALVACIDDPGPGPGPGPNTDYTYADGTTLRVGAAYNNSGTAISMDSKYAGNGVTLADGKTYNTGDLKPTWVELQKRLDITFQDVYTTAAGKNANEMYKYWSQKLGEVDILNGQSIQLTEGGRTGKVVDLNKYMGGMPNFKAFLDSNPIARLSVTGNTTTGGIYFAPYFDGNDDIERMPLMRTDWVKKLLDGDGAFTATASADLKAAVYTPYMPATGKVVIQSLTKDGSATQNLTKDYTAAGNIVAKLNEELGKGTVTGVQAVNMLRTYIDQAYGNYYGTTRSNLFVGADACWDADELVALLRCVVANAQTLNGGTQPIWGMFSRENSGGNGNQRGYDLVRLAGHLFGVRGFESRQDYLYFNSKGELCDARQSADSYEAVARLNALTKEGLMGELYATSNTKSDDVIKNDAGFMSYDYNQTQTVMNEKSGYMSEGEEYRAVMVPVALWHDGVNTAVVSGETVDNGTYMRFTESWRSVKPEGWAISAELEKLATKDKLNAALAFVDYMYSPAGQILMSYGPDEFIKTKADGTYETFDFNGQQMPVIADATYEELWSKATGNYTNYARQFLGSTLAFVKSQAFEYQCTTEVGRQGSAILSKAISKGIIKHPALAIEQNMWYTSLTAILPTTAAEDQALSSFDKIASTAIKPFGQGNNAGSYNVYLDIIKSGLGSTSTDLGLLPATGADFAKMVNTQWSGAAYLLVKGNAVARMLEYYATIK